VRADRLLAILLTLQSRGRTTAEALAEDLGVSVRTVYRDLTALGSAGIPVCTSGGPGGGCWLMDGYRSGLTGLTATEAEALMRLGLPGPLQDLGLGQAMSNIRRKLSAAHAEVAGDGTRFLIDAPAWFRPVEDVPTLPILVEAVQRGREVRLSHRKDPSVPARGAIVAALGLVCKSGSWYLVCQLRERIAVYRASRIVTAEILEREVTRPAGFDLAEFWREWSQEFEATRPRVEVSVRVSLEMLPVLPEVFGESLRPTLDASAAGRDGSRILKLTFESIGAAAYRLIGFGAGLEVLEPQTVRDQIALTAAKALQMYVSGDKRPI
jgi:predicted DNA-binding transcriptional regulator YafY